MDNENTNDAQAITKFGHNSSLLQNLINRRHTPDILDCIANLSNDEVFTSPELANKVLDLLPEEVWHDKNLKWLDPACKTGIFLRQIAVRLMEGLRDEFPDEEERRHHIFQNMLYGIAITNLTALMSRRSLYTSKNANSDKSIAGFTDENGNISYDNRPHTYKNGSCIFCGNSENGKLDRDETLERHAYNFIHLTSEEANNMKFDVIVGNPPYQLGDGGHGASASPIYQFFVRQAKKLKPKYLAFIIPSRWFAGGKGLDDFRDEMMHDHSVKILVDYPNSADCFPGVDIKGGVCYFVREEGYDGPCEYTIMSETEVVSKTSRYLEEGNAGVVVRYPEMLSILEKVQQKGEETFDKIVSSRKPYGIATDFFKSPKKYGFPEVYKEEKDVRGACIKIHGLDCGRRVLRFVPLGYPFIIGRENVTKWKIFIPKAYGEGVLGEKITNPILGEPLFVCTETFRQIGPFDNEKLAKNALRYIQTNFFTILVNAKKTTQDARRDAFSVVPLLDFNEEWTDEKLYKRYNLSSAEIEFIETNVKGMV